MIPQTIEFITDNLFTATSDWNQREAAIIAFGCIIEGPCKYKTKQLVNEVSFFLEVYLFYHYLLTHIYLDITYHIEKLKGSEYIY